MRPAFTLPAPRALALALLAVGLGAGALADRVPDDPPPMQDGRYVLAVDLHVHSFLGDGALGPWNLGREARRRGLDALVISNHNRVFASQLGRWLSRYRQSLGAALILTGAEITHPGHHIVGVGLEGPVDWKGSASEVIAAIHAQGGVAIAAHAVRGYWKSFDDASLRALDGIEVVHPMIYRYPDGRAELGALFARANRVRASAGQPPLAAIGSSDFHTTATLGRCRTFVFARELSQAAIVEAIKEGRTVAYAEGDVPPSYARSSPLPTPRRAGIVGWLGLFLLLVLAPGGQPSRSRRENLSADLPE
jgi:predicted metal-dependent phosphoesterase TrpH